MFRHHIKAIFTAFLLGTLALFLGVSCVSDRTASYAPTGAVSALSPVGDAWEPYNRSVQAFNSGFERHVAHPASQIWRFLLPSPVRTGLSHFSENLGYPLRLVAHALEGQWEYCWSDTKRFAVNTTIGALGFWDPATSLGLPHIDGSFSRTLARWQISSGGYFNLPFAGPGTVRDGVGKLLDLPFNMVTWLVPAPASHAVNGAFKLNDTAASEPTLNRAFVTQPCHYELMKLLVVLGNEAAFSDYKIPVREDYAPDQSFGILAFAPSDDGFYYQARQRRVRLPGGQKFPYTCWPLKDATKLVILLPGIGAHRQSAELAALAEQFRWQGCAVVALSSTFTPDYFANVPGDGCPPGFIPEDAKILAAVLDVGVRYELVSHNVAREKYVMPSRATVKRRDDGIWTLAELLEIDVAGEWWEPAYILSAFGGLRVGESLGVTAQDVELRDVSGVPVAFVHVSKQVTRDGDVLETLKTEQSNRTAFVVGKAALRLAAITNGMDDSWYLTHDGAGNAQPQYRLTRAWTKAGMAHPFRNLRNAWQTWMRWEVGVAPWAIEQAMGHRVAGVTGRYYDRPTDDVIAQVLADAYRAKPWD